MNVPAPAPILMEDPRALSDVTVRRLGAHAVRTALDVFDVRRSVRRHAASVGFSRIASEELAIVASELASNIVKYGVMGKVDIDTLGAGCRGDGLVLCASDEGPAFKNFERATRDRSDDIGSIPPDAMYGRAGIGGGLAAVRRLTHGLFLDQTRTPKSIVVVRYLHRT